MSLPSDEVAKTVHMVLLAIHGIRLVFQEGHHHDLQPQSHSDLFLQPSEQIRVGVSDSPRVCVEWSDGNLDMDATLAMESSLQHHPSILQDTSLGPFEMQPSSMRSQHESIRWI